MQQAVLQHFPTVQATYKFTHRDEDVYFTKECFNLFVESIKRTSTYQAEFISPVDALADFGEVALTQDERAWLAGACPFFKPEYMTYLAHYRFKPEQVHVTFHPKNPSAPVSRYQPPPHANGAEERNELGRIEIEATGPWHETILWEVPLMSTLSELFFTTVDTDWSYDGQEGVCYATVGLC